MHVSVTFRHIHATDALRRYAEGKVARAHKFLRRPIEAHVVLSVVKHRHIAEITLKADHLTVNATEETGDLYSAIDLAMSKLERQIKKHVTKRKSRKHVAAPEVARPAKAETPARRRAPRVKAERVSVEPMTVAQAVRRADDGGVDLLLFTNVSDDALNVLYRRKDGSYGLLQPEGAES